MTMTIRQKAAKVMGYTEEFQRVYGPMNALSPKERRARVVAKIIGMGEVGTQITLVIMHAHQNGADKKHTIAAILALIETARAQLQDILGDINGMEAIGDMDDKVREMKAFVEQRLRMLEEMEKDFNQLSA